MRFLGRVLVFSTLAAAASLVAAAEPATVDDLWIALADLTGLTATDGPSAAAALRDAGYPMPDARPGTPLTEAWTTRTLNAVGFHVTTRRPDAVVTGDRLSAMLAGLAPELDGADPETSSAEDPGPYPRPNDEAADPATKGRKNGSTKGKGKKKGHGVSPSMPM